MRHINETKSVKQRVSRKKFDPPQAFLWVFAPFHFLIIGTVNKQESRNYTEVISMIPRDMFYFFCCLIDISFYDFFYFQGQVIYPPNSGYAVNQYPGGVPAGVVPMQTGGGMVPVQTVVPWLQGGQPQMGVVPVSGMEGNQPQLAQIAASGALATGYQPQVATSEAMATAYQPQMPPKYGYTKFENDEV